MTGLEIIGIIGIVGWIVEQVIAAIPIDQNSTTQVLRAVFKAMAGIKK